MTWLRRLHEGAAGTAATTEDEAATDSPTTLLQNLHALIGFINQNAGRLPAESVVAARRVTDAVRDVIDTNVDGVLDVYAIVSIRGIVGDYLPTTLRAYLALSPDVLDTPRGDGRTPKQLLLDQLTAMWSGAAEVRTAARARDADALATQGNFLQTKFTRSDLDI
ncbi:MAG: hypothetical protein M3O28_03310 [Actinomycetota bacterium]|nr:hypothetical protein [Actinomycetota bacterium]